MTSKTRIYSYRLPSTVTECLTLYGGRRERGDERGRTREREGLTVKELGTTVRVGVTEGSAGYEKGVRKRREERRMDT